VGVPLSRNIRKSIAFAQDLDVGQCSARPTRGGDWSEWLFAEQLRAAYKRKGDLFVQI